MQIERTKNSAKNIISGFIMRIISMLMPFIIRTLIIKKLGVDYLGLNSLFSSILQVLSLSELGFATAVAYSMYKPIAEDNKELICALLNLIKKIYRVVGIIILILGIAVMPFLTYLIEGDYPQDINLYILYSIYLINTAISYFLFAYKGVLLSAHNKTDIENNITTIAYVIMYVSQIIILLTIQNYYVYLIMLPVSTLIINFLRSYMVKKKYPEYIANGMVDAITKKRVYANIGALIGHRLSGVAVAPVSHIIISAMLGLTEVAIYDNYYYVINALLAIVGVVYVSITAGLGNSIVTESIEANRIKFNNLTFLNVWIIGWMSICLLCLYQPFMVIWVGEELTLPFYCVVLFVIYFYSWKFKDLLCTYKEAAGMWKADLLKPYVVTVIDIILNVVLIKYWGIAGTLVATIISIPVICLPWETHVFFKGYLGKGEGRYYLKLLIYTICLVAIAAFTYFICGLLPANGIGWFILKAIICVFLPNCLIILLTFKTSEFKWILGKLKYLIARH